MKAKATKAAARPTSSGRKAKRSTPTQAATRPLFDEVLYLLQRAATLASKGWQNHPDHPDADNLSRLSEVLHAVLLLRREALASGQELIIGSDPTRCHGPGFSMSMRPRERTSLSVDARDRINALANFVLVRADHTRNPEERSAARLYGSVLQELVTMTDVTPAGHLLVHEVHRAKDGKRCITLGHLAPTVPVEPKPEPEQGMGHVLPFRRKGKPKATTAAGEASPLTLRSP